MLGQRIVSSRTLQTFYINIFIYIDHENRLLQVKKTQETPNLRWDPPPPREMCQDPAEETIKLSVNLHCGSWCLGLQGNELLQQPAHWWWFEIIFCISIRHLDLIHVSALNTWFDNSTRGKLCICIHWWYGFKLYIKLNTSCEVKWRSLQEVNGTSVAVIKDIFIA